MALTATLWKVSSFIRLLPLALPLVTGLSLPLFPNNLVLFFFFICPDVSGYAGTVYDGTAIKTSWIAMWRGEGIYIYSALQAD